MTQQDNVDVLYAAINLQNVLYLGSNVPNWNGITRVRVFCSETESRFTIMQEFQVRVTPVNDPPAVIGLIPDQVLFEDFETFIVTNLGDIFHDVDDAELDYELDFNPLHIGLEIDDENNLLMSSVLNWYGDTHVSITADDTHNRLTAQIEFFITVIDQVNNYPVFNEFIEGMIFPVGITGTILDFSQFIETYGENIEEYISYQLIGSEQHFTLQNVAGEYFALYAIPVNTQYPYHSQSCRLILPGGAEAVIVLTTNLSPNPTSRIPNINRTPDEFPVIDHIDLNSCFSDPEGSVMSYSAVYPETHLTVTIDGSMLSVDIVDGFTGTAQVTINATDDIGLTGSSTFSVTVIAPAARRHIVAESGQEKRVRMSDLFSNIGRDYELSRSRTAVIDRNSNEVVINFTTEETVTETITLTQKDEDGNEIRAELEITVRGNAAEYMTGLTEIYPNPFNPAKASRSIGTTINFCLKTAGNVEIAVYNMKGQLVKSLINTTLSAGVHNISWEGSDNNNKPASSGIYFINMKTNGYHEMKKVILVK